MSNIPNICYYMRGDISRQDQQKLITVLCEGYHTSKIIRSYIQGRSSLPELKNLTLMAVQPIEYQNKSFVIFQERLCNRSNQILFDYSYCMLIHNTCKQDRYGLKNPVKIGKCIKIGIQMLFLQKEKIGIGIRMVFTLQNRYR